VFLCDVLVYMQVGDGTTTVVILSGELLRAAKPFVEEGVHPRVRLHVAFKPGHMHHVMCMWLVCSQRYASAQATRQCTLSCRAACHI
jgi:hypothetical protein